jgi:hypothetical protein
VYVQKICTGSYFHKAAVTNKYIASYDKSENYNDHPTDDKIIIYINLILTTCAYQDYIAVRLGNISSLTIRVRDILMCYEYTKMPRKKSILPRIKTSMHLRTDFISFVGL